MATELQTIVSSSKTEDEIVAPESFVPVEFIDISEERIADSTANDSAGILQQPLSNLRKIAVVSQLSGVNFTACGINGLVIVALPAITADLQLPQSLAFWPTSVTNLATASTLLIAGSVADIIGPRWVDLAGCITAGAFMLGSGAAKTGPVLVGMRAIQGVGVAMHFSSSVGIVSSTFPPGRGRNIAFSCLGLSQPLGFSFGLVIGGVLVDTLGWRAGWFLFGAITLALAGVGFWALPNNKKHQTPKDVLHNVRVKIDWVGAILATAFMALLSYLLAVLSTDVYKIKSAECIIMLCLCVVAVPSFLVWVDRQVRHGKPALIPNSLWKNQSFYTVCVIVALSNAVLNSLELFASLYFQKVQHLSALDSSVRFLPSQIVGVITNIVVGLCVDKVPTIWIASISSILCAGSPLLMAVIHPSWPYWADAFVAQILQPISCDAMFTVGLLVITEVFPEDTQALAGAVFNTASQFGCALGLAIVQVVSTMVTKNREKTGDPHALMEGYRASFWAMFAFMITCLAMGLFGFRKTGRIGLKQD